MNRPLLNLYIGNHNYSSWSLRPWLALRAFDIPFTAHVIPLDQADTDRKIREVSPSGRVPVLVTPEGTVWESLSICEYLADRFPEKNLWPIDPRARAWARSVSNEMHAGFSALRTQCPMNIRLQTRDFEPNTETRADLERIDQIWTECRRAFAARGPYLFGAFSIADAMYAPVVFRTQTYGLRLSPEATDYRDTMLKHPALQEWAKAAHAETFKMPRYESNR